MNPANRERLRKNHVLLKECLDIPPLLDHMYQERIFSLDEVEQIRCKATTSERSQEFLETLVRKGNDGYMTCCKVLGKLQNNLLKTLADTELDHEILGEKASANIFFDPSDDFEVKGLVDELTKDDLITKQQLERMKNFVIGKPGCAEEIIEKIQTPGKFLRHLMKNCLMTRYNLTFLQALLWRVHNKSLCLQVAHFARTCCQKPIYFYSPPKEAENGYAFGKFHIEGNAEYFKGITIEDICNRVSRYLGIPLSQVVPMGVEPSTSLFLTIMIPLGAMETLKSVDNWSWLASLGIDYIQHDGGKIVIEGPIDETQSYDQVLQTELKRRIETEQHLKQCLYTEQVSNENLKDLQNDLEERLNRSEHTTKELNRWYTRVFAALLISFHFIAELFKEKRNILLSGSGHFGLEMFNIQFINAFDEAKRWSSNHDSLMKLVDATRQTERLRDRNEIDYLRCAANASLVAMQQNLNEAITMRMSGRQLVLPERNVSISLVCELDPIFVDILKGLSNKLSNKQLHKICHKFNIPEHQSTPDLKSRIVVNILCQELSKPGNQEMSMEVADAIVKACFTEAGRPDLCREYLNKIESLIRSRAPPQHKTGQREHKSKKEEADHSDRLDKIEKLLETVVEQTKKSNIGVGGFSDSGFTGLPGYQDLFWNKLRTPKFPFKSCAQNEM